MYQNGSIVPRLATMFAISLKKMFFLLSLEEEIATGKCFNCGTLIDADQAINLPSIQHLEIFFIFSNYFIQQKINSIYYFSSNEIQQTVYSE